MTDFPTLSQGQDSSKFSVEYEDVAIGSQMEGGYVITRPRHTRRPRRKFTTGFTDVSQADFLAFEAFYNAVRGGAQAFNWTHPVTAEVIAVRFQLGQTYKADYAGRGGNHRWNITNIRLEEV